ncbi:MAG: ACP S-malonyltransferase [Proteobacteria bacterium]|nr:ACP S-malonyltransferase [Pseudomonadota bacterium]
MAVFMFPGQGSQAKGMGGELFSQFPDWVKLADEILGYSIKELCLYDPETKLANTAFTQPALFIVEVLALELKKDASIKPAYYIGHSLGEYAALYAANAFDFATGLQLVQKRGELMAEAHSGGMLAVLNLPQERIICLLEGEGLNSIDIANYNSKDQIVLSGPAADIAKAKTILSKETKLCILLNTSGAFHSRYMEDAAKIFEQFINQFDFLPLQTEVISNVTAKPYANSNIKENLVKQIFSSVHWSEIISYLKDKGETEFVEIGPGNVLTRLMRQN